MKIRISLRCGISPLRPKMYILNFKLERFWGSGVKIGFYLLVGSFTGKAYNVHFELNWHLFADLE